VERVLTINRVASWLIFLTAAVDILTKVAADQKPGGVRLAFRGFLYSLEIFTFPV
jgi:hypothetical protein